VEFRNDAGGNIHTVVGKLSFSEEDLKANVTAFVDNIRRMKPASAKGHYIKKICLSGTMTPSVEIEVAAAAAE
jgi:large subunit ribosomal protein L1